MTEPVTGPAAWHQRQILIFLMVVTGTLLVCDAWFDLALAYKALDDILDTLGLDEKQLEGQHLARAQLLDDGLRASARKRVQSEASREASELEKTRRLISS